MSPLQAQDKQTSVGHVTGVVDRTLNMAWLNVHTRQNQLNILIRRRIEAERKRHRTWETPCRGGGGKRWTRKGHAWSEKKFPEQLKKLIWILKEGELFHGVGDTLVFPHSS